MIKKIKRTTIITRLIISFVLVIIIFILGIIQANSTTASVDRLHRYNLNYVVGRAEVILDIQQEFMSFRLLARASIMNETWRVASSLGTILEYERILSAHQHRIGELAEIYISLVQGDYRIAAKEGACIHMDLIEEILYKMATLYGTLAHNFFVSGDPNFDDTNMSASSDEIISLLDELQAISILERNETLEEINENLSYNTLISAYTVIAALLLSGLIVFVMLKSFKENIKNLEYQVALVEEGDFESSLAQGETNEISRIFTGLINIFTDLTEEINKVSEEVKSGIANARINTLSFKGSYKKTAAAINALIDEVEKYKEKEIEATKRASLVFENAPLAISFWSKNGIVDCNRDFVKMFEAEHKSELLNSFLLEYTPELQPCGTPSSEMQQNYIQQTYDEGLIKFEWMHADKQGKPLPCEVTLVRIEFYEEKDFAAYARDLREEKKIAAQLQDANTRGRIIFEKAPLTIAFWSDNFEVIDINDECVKMFGLEDKSEYREKFFSLSPTLQPCGTPSHKKAREMNELALEKGFLVFDWMHCTAKGEIFPCEITSVRIQYHGKPALVIYVRDMREILASQERIREANERVQLMLDSTPMACFLINKYLEAIDCNMEAVNLFKLESRIECLSHFQKIFTNEPQDKSGQKLESYFNMALKENYTKFEWDLRAPEGSVIPCEIVFVRLTYKDDFVIAAYVSDLRVIKKMIEDMKRLEAAEENSLAKSKFLARMSHEIRTPITAVIGISEIQLQNPHLSINEEEAFAKIRNSAEILLGIINDILDISRIESGKMELGFDTYDVTGIIIDTLQMHLVYLGSKDIKFMVNADPDTFKYLAGDELRIKQVLNNVLSNAIKYTDVGRVTLDIYCEDIQGSDFVNLVIKISDTGKGMTEAQIESLYNEYARFHEKDAPFTAGTGLGMPIVYNLVGLMDGSIDVESKVAVGTSVTIKLPQKVVGDEKIGAEAAENLRKLDSSVLSVKQKLEFSPTPMPYGSVLIVDDVETNLYVARGLLDFYELKVEEASSGSQAIEKIKSGKVYDIIFMDHMMPEMDGIETTKILRHLGYNEPIVAFTANALIGQAEEFMKSGFDGFISKPIQINQLNNILNKFIKNKQTDTFELNEDYDEYGDYGDYGDEMHDYYSDPEIAEAIRKDFLANQKNAVEKTMEALEEGDFKTARLLIHTLKGVAALMREFTLSELAQEAESAFKEETIPQNWPGNIQEEMSRVIKKLESI